MSGCKIASGAVIALFALMIGGCAPKVGEDILIEPQGNIRWENSQAEVMLGVLSLLGISTKSGEIRLGSDLKLVNKWHSDITVVSLDYTLTDGKEVLVKGEAKRADNRPYILPSSSEKMIPLEFRIDTRNLNNNRILSLLDGKKKLWVRGEAIIEIWGIKQRYPYEKEVTSVIHKALNGK
jgi:hypothetical protein